MQGWEEILFENRNKKYGAYMLRKKSGKYLALGLLFSLLFIFLTSVTLFVILNSDLFFTEKLPKTISIEAMQMADLQDFKFPEPPPKAEEKANADLSKIEIVDSTVEVKKKSDTLKNTAHQADTTKKGSETEDTGIGANLKGDSLYIRVDKMPEFVGGKEALSRFLIKNLAETAHKSKVRLRVIAQFTVAKTGDVREIVIVAGGNPDINRDIIKVIGMLPRWEPAQQSGHPVSFRFNLPINL